MGIFIYDQATLKSISDAADLTNLIAESLCGLDLTPHYGPPSVTLSLLFQISRVVGDAFVVVSMIFSSLLVFVVWMTQIESHQLTLLPQMWMRC